MHDQGHCRIRGQGVQDLVFQVALSKALPSEISAVVVHMQFPSDCFWIINYEKFLLNTSLNSEEDFIPAIDVYGCGNLSLLLKSLESF